MVGDAHDAIRNGETDLSHRLTIKKLFDRFWAWVKPHPHCAHARYAGGLACPSRPANTLHYKVVMTVQHIILSAPQFLSGGRKNAVGCSRIGVGE